MSQEHITNNSEETKKFGENLSQKIKTGTIIGLVGDLGSGKTTFIQGLAKGLGIKEKVLSPTFLIERSFRIKDKKFYHFDCYRIKKTKELLDLGFKEIVSGSKNIVAVEWADKVKKIMPENALWIRFKHISENKRKIIMKKPAANRRRL